MYPPSLERGLGWSGTLDTVLDLTGTTVDDSVRMGLPVVVGETGARDDVDNALVFLDQVYDAFDADRLSATQWEGGHASGGSYAIFDETGAPSAIGRTIARPHPARTAGEPIAWSWDGETFTYEWREREEVRGWTLVTLPSVAFPDGVEATLDDGGEAPRRRGTRLALLALSAGRAARGTRGGGRALRSLHCRLPARAPSRCSRERRTLPRRRVSVGALSR